MIDLSRHYAESAQRFLQTAIVIDDQALMGPTEPVVLPAAIKAPTGSLLGSEAESAGHPSVEITLEQNMVSSSKALNARILSQAFLDRRMICGLYRPESGEDMVTRASGAAEAADIIVVDWHLETGKSQPAKEIILNVLQKDVEEKGRLRLIAIYTSQPGREAIAVELLSDIEQQGILKDRFKRLDTVISDATTRIVVLNKRSTPNAADRDEVTEERLPERLVNEFAKLTTGVMPSFALSSVAAIRKGAHHVLSLYTSQLDGAFVAHRCGIPYPEDSKAFAVDMITSELRNLIEVADVAGETLGEDVIEAWIQKKIDAGEPFRTDRAEVPANLVKGFVTEGVTAVQRSAEHQTAFQNTDGKLGKDHKVTSGTLSRIFYSSADAARTGVQELARLSTFQREPHRTRLPESWAPKLTLGSVIQSIDNEAEILLCVQPRCDSIRLNGETAFPFQTVGNGTNFNLIVRDINGVDQSTWVNLKPRDTKMVRFGIDATRKAVFAQRDAARKLYVFTAATGETFAWLGDLKVMKAQRWASELGTRVQVVGIDEFEWLRQAGERQIRSSWA